jgi:hypothetical protein
MGDIDRINREAQMTAPITIRPAHAKDGLAVARLAALDSADNPPPAPLLVAEVDGAIRVAVSLRDGSAIADPFFATVDILALVRTRAAGTNAFPSRRRLHHRLRYALG